MKAKNVIPVNRIQIPHADRKKYMNSIIVIVAILFSFMLNDGAIARNFITSTEHDPVLISQRSEIAIGRSTDRQMRQTYKVSTDQKFNQSIDSIGQKLAVCSKRNNLKFTFTVLDDELVNAFAAPGGYVYITTGILKKLRNEDEIAGVLGHEIGHVVHRHSLKALQRRMIAQFGLQVVAAKLGDAGAISGALIHKASELSASLLFLKNSRGNELQADSEGVKIMHLAGYNPQAMVDIQTMLLKLSKGKHPPAIISTHPPSQERIDAIRKAIEKMRQDARKR
jgi:predicted Zn-dependent protease